LSARFAALLIAVGYARVSFQRELLMSQATVGRWGRNLAIRVPSDIARRTKLTDGERVEVEAHDGDILIRRPSVKARRSAVAAADEIIEERRHFRLSRTTMRRLLAEGRRG
jgi:antitoxin component of MazEF toxin-antitoxin module